LSLRDPAGACARGRATHETDWLERFPFARDDRARLD